MADNSLRLMVPNADFSAAGNGRLVEIPTFSALYAAYLIGTAWGDPLKDQSGNGRNLTNEGAVIGATSAQFANAASGGKGFATPFAGSALSGQGVTFVAVQKPAAPNQSTLLLSNYQEGGGSGATASLGSDATSSTKPYATGFTPSLNVARNPVDATQGGYFEMNAAIIDVAYVKSWRS